MFWTKTMHVTILKWIIVTHFVEGLAVKLLVAEQIIVDVRPSRYIEIKLLTFKF